MTAAAVPSETQAASFPVAEAESRTATTTFGPFANPNGAGALFVVIKSSAITSTPSVTFKIQGYDKATGATWDILTSAAVVDATTTIVMRVSPQLTAAANTIAKDHVPFTWQLVATHADADAITYQVQAHYVGG